MRNLLFLLLIVLLFSSCSASRVLNVQQELQPEVCAHYNGADATVLQATDNYYPANWKMFQSDDRKYSAAWAEFLAFKYNVPLHVFLHEVRFNEISGFYKTGRGGVSIYYPSCALKYSKVQLNKIRSNIEFVTGNYPVTLSYGCGNTIYASLLPDYIIGGRNSAYTPWNSGDTAITWYGKDCGFAGKTDFSITGNIRCRAAAGRFYSDLKNNASVDQAASFVKEQVGIAVDNKGFYVNFMHWHDGDANDSIPFGIQVMEPLFDAISAGTDNAYIAKIDYDKAVKYLYLKEAVSALNVFHHKKNLNLNIQLDKFREIDYSVIDIPLTIRLKDHKTGKLNYKKIAKNIKVESISQFNDHIYLNLNVDMSKDEFQVSLPLTRKKQSYPLLFEMPSLSFDPASGAVSSSIPVLFVLFRRDSEANNYEVQIIDRTYTTSDVYQLPPVEGGYIYFLGAISPKGESTLMEVG